MYSNIKTCGKYDVSEREDLMQGEDLSPILFALYVKF